MVGSRRVSRDACGAGSAGLNVHAGREGTEVGGLPEREIALAFWANLRMVTAMKPNCRNTGGLEGRTPQCCHGALPKLAV